MKPISSKSLVKGAVVAKGVVWRVVEVIGSEVLAFGSFIIMARLLLPEDFGVVSQAALFILTLQLVLQQGLPEALVQREEVEDAHFDTCFWANLALGAAAAALLIAGAPLAALVFSEPNLVPVLIGLAPTLIILSASRIMLAKLRRAFQFQGFFVLNVSATFAGAITATAMATSGFGVWSLVAQQWVYAVVGLVAGWVCSRWMPRLRFDWRHVREMWVFSGFTVIEAFLSFCTRRLDLLILAIFWSASEVGFYFLANRLLFSVGMLTYYSISHLGLPFLARLAADPTAYQEAIYRTMRLVSLACLPTLIGLALVANQLIPLLFGEAWIKSIAPFQMLGLFSIFYALTLMSGQVLISAGHARDAMVISGLNMLLFLVAVWFAAPHGITAVAAAGGLANLIAIPIYLRQLHCRFAINAKRLFRDQAPCWLATTTMAAVVLVMQQWLTDMLVPWANLMICSIAGAATFMIIMMVLARAELAQIYSSFVEAGRSKAEPAIEHS